jgi:DNA-binding CsgD family transcriptional regulator
VTRAEKVQTAQRCVASGMSQLEIATMMGVSRSTVNEWLCDPYRLKAKARRARYSTPCVDCGKPTDGSGGYADQRERCNKCNRKHDHENRKWTAERIIRWIKDYVEEHGKVPPATVQVAGNGAPDTKIVRREFGTNGWRRAVIAAGFEPIMGLDHVGTGHRLGQDHPLMVETVRLYEDGLSPARIAEQHGVTDRAIRFRLKHLGVKMRSHEEAQQLRRSISAAVVQ